MDTKLLTGCLDTLDLHKWIFFSSFSSSYSWDRIRWVGDCVEVSFFGVSCFPPAFFLLFFSYDVGQPGVFLFLFLRSIGCIFNGHRDIVGHL